MRWGFKHQPGQRLQCHQSAHFTNGKAARRFDREHHIRGCHLWQQRAKQLFRIKGRDHWFCKSLSADVSPQNIRVNAVAPGYINTDMLGVLNPDTLAYIKSRISMRCLGKVDDIAPMVCFLLSDNADYITGRVIQIDGGITL